MELNYETAAINCQQNEDSSAKKIKGRRILYLKTRKLLMFLRVPLFFQLMFKSQKQNKTLNGAIIYCITANQIIYH